MNIRDRIQQEVDAFTRLGQPPLLQTFILRNGQEFKTQPYKGKRMTPKECFCNAANRHDGIYAEGYGLRNDMPLLVHHAWRVSEHGNVIDPTWKKPEECQYFGVTMEQDKLWEILMKKGTYSLWDSARGLNYKLMFELDPGLKEIFNFK